MDLAKSYQLGVNGYIPEPVEFDKFREMVKRLGLYRLVVNERPPARAFRTT